MAVHGRPSYPHWAQTVWTCISWGATVQAAHRTGRPPRSGTAGGPSVTRGYADQARAGPFAGPRMSFTGLQGVPVDDPGRVRRGGGSGGRAVQDINMKAPGGGTSWLIAWLSEGFDASRAATPSVTKPCPAGRDQVEPAGRDQVERVSVRGHADAGEVSPGERSAELSTELSTAVTVITVWLRTQAPAWWRWSGRPAPVVSGQRCARRQVVPDGVAVPSGRTGRCADEMEGNPQARRH